MPIDATYSVDNASTHWIPYNNYVAENRKGLKPCPYCKNRKVRVANYRFQKKKIVYCPKCRLSGPTVRTFIAAWNSLRR